MTRDGRLPGRPPVIACDVQSDALARLVCENQLGELRRVCQLDAGLHPPASLFQQ